MIQNGGRSLIRPQELTNQIRVRLSEGSWLNFGDLNVYIGAQALGHHLTTITMVITIPSSKVITIITFSHNYESNKEQKMEIRFIFE